jgi:Na+/melibiose symporter-like transporter
MDAFLLRTRTRLSAYFGSESARVAFFWALTTFSAGTLGLNGLFFNDLFVNRLKIQDSYFVASNIIFAVIDPLNDVLLGWYLDNHDHSTTPTGGALRRLAAARIGGTLWCLTYLLPYFLMDVVKGSPAVGLLYFVSRSAFDTALTMTWIALGALIADIALKHEDRVKCQHFAAISALFGLPLSNIAYRLWAGTENGDMSAFRMFVLTQSILGIVGFQYATRKLGDRLSSSARPDSLKDEQTPIRPSSEGDQRAPARRLTITEYARQVSTQRNLIIFLLVNVPQETLYSFTGTFFTAFIDGLLRHKYSVGTNAAVITLASVPVNVVLYPLVTVLGTYQVWRFGIFAKIGLCGLVYLAGPDFPFAIATFLVMLNLFQASMGGQFGLIMTDLTDEDQVRFNRPHNYGARFMGTNALFAKPMGALTPLLGRWILGDYEPETAGLFPEFRQRCFAMMVFVPLVISVWQAFWWERYNLKGETLALVKKRVAAVRESFSASS